MAIRGFKHEGLQLLFEQQIELKLPAKQLRRVRYILTILDADIFFLPASRGYNLQPLKGARKGEWAVKVSAGRRVTFRLEDGGAYDVDLIERRKRAAKR